ncbi:MAG: glutathione S-transferase C-terminal domain-containing protein, partial [Alphaproteobacteria bacterium]
QVADVLAALEADRAARTTPWWFGAAIGHADIAVGCALRFVGEVHPGLFEPARWPALAAHAARCEALPAFQEISQPFKAPGQ